MPRALAALLLTAALPLLGCASTSKVQIRSTSQTNDGNTLYVMVRSVDRATSAENYQEAAARLFAEPPDPSVVASQPIFPGNSINLSLDASSKKEMVIYFFFTEPGANWRLPLVKPLPSEVQIDLGVHQIERVQVRRR